MAFVDVPEFMFPPPPSNPAGAPGITTTQVKVDGAGGEVSYIFQAPKDGDVYKIHWRTGTVTTGCTLDVRLETVTTSTGLPSGSLVEANANATQVVANGDDNVNFTTTLTANGTVSKGTWYAVRFDVSSGTPATLGIATFQDGGLNAPPYVVEGTGMIVGVAPILGIEYSDLTIPLIPGCIPLSAITTINFSNSSTPDVYGNLINLDVPLRISGLWFMADIDGDFDLKVFSSDGVTVAKSVAGYTNVPIASATTVSCFRFASSLELSANTDYYVCCEPNTTTNLGTYTFDAGSATLAGAFPWVAHLTSAKNPSGTGSWTTDNTRQFLIGLLVDGIDVTAASSGSAYAFAV